MQMDVQSTSVLEMNDSLVLFSESENVWIGKVVTEFISLIYWTVN